MFDKEFYDKVKCYSDAHDLSMAQGIRQYTKENNIQVPPSVPADPEMVKTVVARLLEEDKEIIRALKDRP